MPAPGRRTTRQVIFLDIDGVVAPILRWDRYGELDPTCIQVLNEIAGGAGADVVVSSTWRHGKTVAELQALLDAAGFTGRVLDKTPAAASGAPRGEEIAAWLNGRAVDGYVILDDHADMGALRSHLILTHPARGLQPEDAPLALAVLARAPQPSVHVGAALDVPHRPGDEGRLVRHQEPDRGSDPSIRV